MYEERNLLIFNPKIMFEESIFCLNICTELIQPEYKPNLHSSEISNEGW